VITFAKVDRVVKSLVLVTLLIGVPSVLAQPPDGRLAMSVNLREALDRKP